MSDWKLLVNGGDQPVVAISQVAQAALGRAGITIQLDLKQGAEYTDALLRRQASTPPSAASATSRSSRAG